MTAATVFMQVATSLLTRQKRFGPIARTNVYNQVGYVAFAFSAGPFLGALGLVAAKLAGQLVGISLVLRYVASNIYRYFRLQNLKLPSQRFHGSECGRLDSFRHSEHQLVPDLCRSRVLGSQHSKNEERAEYPHNRDR